MPRLSGLGAAAGITRIAIAALAAELLAILSLIGVIVFVFVSEPLSFGQGERLAREIADWVIPVAGFVPCLLAGWWAGRKLGPGARRRRKQRGDIASAWIQPIGRPFHRNGLTDDELISISRSGSNEPNPW